VEISCLEIVRELSNYLDDGLSENLRSELEAHLGKCRHCRAVWDGLRNTVTLIGDGQVFELPVGFSERLRKRLKLRFLANGVSVGARLSSPP
jgi:anti-sigma factor RsiW